MKKTNHAVLSMTAICVVLGVIIGVQVKTVHLQTASSAIDVQRASELSLELKKVMEERDALQEQLSVSQLKLQQYEESTDNESHIIQLLKDDLTKARMASGEMAVTGRGVVVTMNDSSTASQGAQADINAYLVHAEDLLSVINELNVAGAEAVSINGQRIIGTSSIRCAGSIVNVNGVKIAAPFVIHAIGDPEVLEAALRFPGGVIDSLSPWGIEISVKRADAIEAPGYTQGFLYKEASPVKEAQ